MAFNAQAIAGTEYELRGSNHLIHYTSSIQNVIEILYDGCLRLKNLIALNDPQELIYVINSLKLKSFESYIEYFKSTYFSASFCKVEDLNQPDKFPLWRLYGGHGFGCAIVFEVEQHQNNWIDFMLGQVQYEDIESAHGASRRLRSLFEFHDSFQESHNSPMRNIPITFPALLAFHKNQIWSDEKEIRLLSYHDYDHFTLKDNEFKICELKHSIDRRNNRCSYIELPLFGGKQYNELKQRGRLASLNKLLPILKIKKIIPGYQLGSKLFDLQNVINYISNTYGYEIEVKESHLKKYLI